MFHKSIPLIAAAIIGFAPPVLAQTAVPFTLDWRFEGPAAPYFLAIDNGHFKAVGLDVEVSAGEGSLDAIPKVASGAFPLGFADINSLIRFLDQNPGAPVPAVMMVYDRPPFSIVGRKSLGINGISDLEGKKLGAPPPDGAWAQFPILAAVNNIDVSKITVEPVGFPVREPSLAEGTVDAVTGFNFSSYLSVSRLGVPEDDLTTILFADHGVDLYGNAIIVNTEFAAANPQIVTDFLGAVVKGMNDAIADPAAGAAAVIGRNPAGDVALETRRLEMALAANIVTDFAKANGMGGIDPDRMASALEQMKIVYEFQAPADASLYFTDAYLPSAEARALTQ